MNKIGNRTSPEMMPDWTSIKNEYLTDTITLRELAKKYGVSASAICSRSKREGWGKQVEQLRELATAKVKEQVVQQKCDNAERAIRIVDAAMIKIEDGIYQTKSKDSKALKDYVDMLTKLKEFGVFQTAENDVKISIAEEGESYAD